MSFFRKVPSYVNRIPFRWLSLGSLSEPDSSQEELITNFPGLLVFSLLQDSPPCNVPALCGGLVMEPPVVGCSPVLSNPIRTRPVNVAIGFRKTILLGGYSFNYKLSFLGGLKTYISGLITMFYTTAVTVGVATRPPCI